MPRVVHFEFCVENPERAKKFYSSVFGWKIEKWEGGDYYLVDTGTGEGIHGGILKRSHPEDRTCNTIDVPNLNEYVEKVTKAGGKLVSEKMEIPGIGTMAYCEDQDGISFGLMQFDKNRIKSK